MKKVISILLFTSLLVSMCSCVPVSTYENKPAYKVSDTDSKISTNSSDTESIEEKTESKSEEPTFNLKETFNLNDFEITVTKYEICESIESSAYISFEPKERCSYLVLHMNVKNVAKEANTFYQSFSLDGATAKIVYDKEYEYSCTSLLGYDKDLHDTLLNPLTEKDGILAFEMPSSIANEDKSIVLKLIDNLNNASVIIR